MVEVNIHGIFGDRFLKESFTLSLREEHSMKKFFSKIDKHLKVKFFKRNIGRLSDGIVVMVNGQLVHSPANDDILIRDSDQVSIVRVIAGG